LTPDVVQGEPVLLTRFAEEAGDDVLIQWHRNRRGRRAQHDRAAWRRRANESGVGERAVGVPHRMQIYAPRIGRFAEWRKDVAGRERARSDIGAQRFSELMVQRDGAPRIEACWHKSL
jgi:hypothetical protein